MNRKWIIGLGAGLLFFALAAWAVSVAWAQTQTGGPMHGRGSGHMLMHDDMVAALAEALDMDVVTLNERLAAGETMHQIALAEGMTLDEFFAVMQATRAQALAQAVEDGTLTQAQASAMTAHMAQMGGRMMGGGGMMPNGSAGNCPFATPAP